MDLTIPTPQDDSLCYERLIQYLPALQEILHLCRQTEIKASQKTEKPWDLVTNCDKEGGKIWQKHFSQLFPGVDFICEEMPETHELLSTAQKFGLCDPIDGTWRFVHQAPDWGSMLSVWENDKPVETLIFQPRTLRVLLAMRDKLFYWDIWSNSISQLHKKSKDKSNPSALVSLRDYREIPWLSSIVPISGTWDAQSMVELAFTMALEPSKLYHAQSVGKPWDWGPLVHVFQCLGLRTLSLEDLGPWSIRQKLGAISYPIGDEEFFQNLQNAFNISGFTQSMPKFR